VSHVLSLQEVARFADKLYSITAMIILAFGLVSLVMDIVSDPAGT
jgi:hypothetical protein